MKKIILVIAVLFSSFSIFATKTTTRTNGGKKGYKTVTQACSHHWYGDNCSLTCTDPGTENCVWVGCTSSGITTQHLTSDLDNIAFNEIASGNLQGTTEVDGIVISWNGTDIFNYVSIINEYNAE